MLAKTKVLHFMFLFRRQSLQGHWITAARTSRMFVKSSRTEPNNLFWFLRRKCNLFCSLFNNFMRETINKSKNIYCLTISCLFRVKRQSFGKRQQKSSQICLCCSQYDVWRQADTENVKTKLKYFIYKNNKKANMAAQLNKRKGHREDKPQDHVGL